MLKLFAEDKGAEISLDCKEITKNELVFEINHKNADWYLAKTLVLETEDSTETLDLSAYENLNYWVTGESLTETVESGIRHYSNNMYTGVNGDDGVFVIVLDPGHDPGCTDRSWINGVWEPQLNWKIAEAMKKELEGYSNVQVYINRTWEECPGAMDAKECLQARVTRAANLKADLVISLHNNALGVGTLQTSGKGAEVFVTRYLKYNAESKGLAEQVLAELQSIGLSSRGVKTRYYGDDATDTYDDGTGWDYYAINRHSSLMGIPSLLIEHAFMDNAYDLTYLKDDSKLEQIGKCDAQAIIKYYNLQKVTEPMGELSAEQLLSGNININIQNVAAPYGIKEVWLRVYSQGTGVESANWFQASKNGNLWGTTFKTSDYDLESRMYVADLYYVDEENTYNQIKSTTFTIAELPEVTMEAIEKDASQGIFEVNVDFEWLENQISEIYIEAWHNEDKSDNYKYTLEKQEDGKYCTQLNVKNHGYHIGEYQIVCYVKEKNGERTELSSITHNVDLKTTTIKEEKTEDGYFSVISLEGVQTQGIEKWLTFMVWSDKDGQDDIKAYTMGGSEEKRSIEIPLYDFKDTGSYSVHVYVAGKDGKLYFLTKTSFEVEEIQASEMMIAGEDCINGTFDVSAYVNLPQASFDKVYVEAWTENNQGDLYAYEAKIQSDGTYAVQANVKNHGYHIGNYQLRCYVTDAKGKRTDVATVEHEVTITAGAITAEKSANGYSMILNMKDIKNQTAENWLTFMVWSDANGQDDITGYTAVSKNGTCEVKIPLLNHKDAGEYTVHVYMQGKGGKMYFLTQGKFAVDVLPKTCVEVENVNQTQGTLDVKVYLPQRSDVQRLRIPVWTKADQSDIYWYTATVQRDGCYQITVDAVNHQWNSGKYNIHVYAMTTAGLLEYIDSSSIDLTLGIGIREKAINDLSTKLTVYGVTSDAVNVRFPTWSIQNGQDDIYWYNGVKQENGIWSVDIHSKYHKRAGTYVTHVYVDSKSGSVYAGKAEYTITKKQEPGWVWINGYKRYINSDGEIETDVSRLVKGPYFIKVYKWSNYLIVYAKDEYGKFTVPVKAMITSCGNNTPTGTYYTPYKWRWLGMVGGSKAQWCTQISGDYLFHSVPYRIADPTTLYVDNMYNYLGTTQSLGCIRLQAGDEKWIYDNCELGTKVLITPNESSGPLAKPSFTPVPSWHTWDPTDPATKYLCQKYGCH